MIGGKQEGKSGLRQWPVLIPSPNALPTGDALINVCLTNDPLPGPPLRPISVIPHSYKPETCFIHHTNNELTRFPSFPLANVIINAVKTARGEASVSANVLTASNQCSPLIDFVMTIELMVSPFRFDVLMAATASGTNRPPPGVLCVPVPPFLACGNLDVTS